MASESFIVFSATNLLNGAGNSAINFSDTDGILRGSGPFTVGGAVPVTLTLNDQDPPTGTGDTESRFDDGTGVRQFLTAPLTLAYVGPAGLTTTTFAVGTQVQSEFTIDFSSGYRVIGLRIDLPPGSGNLVTAGYALVPPPGGDPTPPAGFALGTVVARNGDGTVPYLGIPCFTASTMIDTPGGPRAVETLAPGSLVRCVEGDVRAVTWASSFTLALAEVAFRPRFWPVEIPPGVLGNAVPLRVSPQHRLLLRHPVVELLTGLPELLAPAVALVGLGGVRRLRPRRAVTYVHFMVAGHEVVVADGAPAETLWPGALQVDELARRLPGAAGLQPAAEVPLARPLARAGEARAVFAAMIAVEARRVPTRPLAVAAG